MAKDSPVIILVRPQMGENIGAAARAMFNFGLTELRLVAPRDGWPNQAASDNAAGAFDEMKEVKVFASLPEAATDLHYLFATTARPRDMEKPVFTPDGAVMEINRRGGQKTGFVFGPERTGLENDEVSHCHAVLTIPANPASPVLNLGQGVLLMAYSWFMAADNTPAHTGIETPAPHGLLDEMLNRLEKELDESRQFFKAENLKPTMMRNIRTMFLRGEWTEQEIRTFHGIISALIHEKEK